MYTTVINAFIMKQSTPICVIQFHTGIHPPPHINTARSQITGQEKGAWSVRGKCHIIYVGNDQVCYYKHGILITQYVINMAFLTQCVYWFSIHVRKITFLIWTAYCCCTSGSKNRRYYKSIMAWISVVGFIGGSTFISSWM